MAKQTFSQLITKLAAIAQVQVISIEEPKPARSGVVIVGSAEDALVFAAALESSKVTARASSYKGKHYVFID